MRFVYGHSNRTLVTGAVNCRRYDLITASALFLLNMSTPNSGPSPCPDASSQPSVGVAAVLSPDSTTLDLEASTSASPPLVGASSLKAPGPGDKMASEGKRKQEDDSDAVDASRTNKKLKLEASNVEELPLTWPEAESTTAAAVENSTNVCNTLRLQ